MLLMNSATPRDKVFYKFGNVTVDCENFCVLKDGRSISLTPRAFDVLVFLLKNDGRVVEKQEIFDSVWKDISVSDNSLTKIIKEIRQALEDSADKPHYIETVPKRGYRFIGEFKEDPNQAAALTETTHDGEIVIEKIESGETTIRQSHETTRTRFAFSKTALAFSVIGLISILILVAWLLFRSGTAKTSPSPIRSIAVLPFKPLNADSRDESLEMGMAETLITRLSNLRQVVVRPMSAVRKYTDPQQDPVKAGQEIQAEAVLDGSIQKAGERVRVTVRLIDVRSGMTFWSEQFDENFTDIFKVQDSIAERITNALTLQLSKYEKEQLAKHSTDNTEAYQLYLRGQLVWHTRRQNWIKQSLAYYQQALEKDPNFALAHIGVADCYIMMSGHRIISMQEAETNARPAIMKALEIDDDLALAHNALAELKYQYEYDWAAAEKEFKKAIELNPNVAWIRQAYGWFLMSEGRFEEAISQTEKARELDPSSLTVNAGRARLFYYSRQYDQAIHHFQNIIAIEPNDRSSYYALYDVYEQKKMYREAVETYLKIRSLNGAKPEKVEEFREAFSLSGWQGFLRKQLQELENTAKTKPVSPYSFANLYVRLGQKDEAFAWFEKTFEARDPSILQFKIEPAYDILRDDPRYAGLIRRIGLQP